MGWDGMEWDEMGSISANEEKAQIKARGICEVLDALMLARQCSRRKKRP